ncbi:hypothetical protein Tco_0745893 [Tanacetum coccineum]
MAQLKYCDKHNQVGFLRKPDESAGFAEIVDFLRGSNLRYALTTNPTTLVNRFGDCYYQYHTNGTLEIKATIDTIRYTISKASIRESLQLDDATEITMLPNDELFEGMGQMGPKGWFGINVGSNMLTALIWSIHLETESSNKPSRPWGIAIVKLVTKVKKFGKGFEKEEIGFVRPVREGTCGSGEEKPLLKPRSMKREGDTRDEKEAKERNGSLTLGILKKMLILLKELQKKKSLNEQQKKRKAQVQFEAQHYTNEDWDLIRAKIEANAELSKKHARK